MSCHSSIITEDTLLGKPKLINLQLGTAGTKVSPMMPELTEIILYLLLRWQVLCI
jgi:hypothetical protein